MNIPHSGKAGRIIAIAGFVMLFGLELLFNGSVFKNLSYEWPIMLLGLLLVVLESWNWVMSFKTTKKALVFIHRAAWIACVIVGLATTVFYGVGQGVARDAQLQAARSDKASRDLQVSTSQARIAAANLVIQMRSQSISNTNRKDTDIRLQLTNELEAAKLEANEQTNVLQKLVAAGDSESVGPNDMFKLLFPEGWTASILALLYLIAGLALKAGNATAAYHSFKSEEENEHDPVIVSGSGSSSGDSSVPELGNVEVVHAVGSTPEPRPVEVRGTPDEVHALSRRVRRYLTACWPPHEMYIATPSQVVDMLGWDVVDCGQLHDELFQGFKLVPHGTKLEIEPTISRDKFLRTRRSIQSQLTQS